MKYLLMSAAMLLLVTGCKLGNGKNREEVCETDMTRAGQEIKNDSVANIADSIRLYLTYPLPDGTEYGYTFLEFGALQEDGKGNGNHPERFRRKGKCTSHQPFKKMEQRLGRTF